LSAARAIVSEKSMAQNGHRAKSEVDSLVISLTQRPERPCRWGGLLQRKEVWVLSRRGWTTVIAVLTAAFFGFVFGIGPFLALTSRPKPDILVLEGWIPDYALLEGWHEFQDGHYSTLLTVGGPFRSGVDLDPDDDYADLAALKLRKMVGQEIPVQPVPCPLEKRDRTFTCAVTVKAWLAQRHPTATAVTVVTLGDHARRSRLLYEKAFGPSVDIGVVALEDQDYDASHWWKYSEGVKEIISESAAYIYARLFFHPSE
jgi:hypothetical protein